MPSSLDRAAQAGALASAIMLYSWASASLQAGGGGEGLDGTEKQLTRSQK